MSNLFYINNNTPKTITFNDKPVTSVFYNNNWVWGKEYNEILGLKFISASEFAMATSGDTSTTYDIMWDGTMEYSKDYGETWSEWDGRPIFAENVDGEYVVCLRGKNNTYVSRSALYGITSSLNGLRMSGSNVRCVGNIETLLDYELVRDGFHPVMAESCFNGLFINCSCLISAPELPATTLTDFCYATMFAACGITEFPELPAMNLAEYCYYNMFHNCSNLKIAPKLPATTLANNCYTYMFDGCWHLAEAPELPAMNLANNCYAYMFSRCWDLTKTPALPAKILAYGCYKGMFASASITEVAPISAIMMADYCYEEMFKSCDMITPPELPATMLAMGCYNGMFKDCDKLTTAPILPATELQSYCYQEMFSGCEKLVTPPALPATTLAPNCYYKMFYNCDELTALPALPATELPYECYRGMFNDCYKLKISTSPTATNVIPYRIPSSGTATYVGTNALTNMFYGSLAGVGTPDTETTYYTNATIIE
jgi:hypothetical protein